MFSFTARTLRWFLSAGSTRYYFHRQEVSAFLATCTRNNKLHLFNHELDLLYEQASSHTS